MNTLADLILISISAFFVSTAILFLVGSAGMDEDEVGAGCLSFLIGFIFMVFGMIFFAAALT